MIVEMVGASTESEWFSVTTGYDTLCWLIVNLLLLFILLKTSNGNV